MWRSVAYRFRQCSFSTPIRTRPARVLGYRRAATRSPPGPPTSTTNSSPSTLARQKDRCVDLAGVWQVSAELVRARLTTNSAQRAGPSNSSDTPRRRLHVRHLAQRHCRQRVLPGQVRLVATDRLAAGSRYAIDEHDAVGSERDLLQDAVLVPDYGSRVDQCPEPDQRLAACASPMAIANAPL